MKATLGILFAALTLAGTASGDDEPIDLDKLFRAGIELAGDGKHAEALVLYDKILAEAPDATGVLYNAGLSAYLSGIYDAAVVHWKRLKGLDAGDWQVRSKLVQSYQALGKREKREIEIKDLYRLREKTKDDAFRKKAFYCRDQFPVGKQRVFAFEHFELVGERAVRISFGVNNEKGEMEYEILLGSYESTNQMMRELGQLEEGQRAYHLDGYYPWGHATYRFYKGEPDYDELRKFVIAIVEGEVEPLTSSRTAPEDAEEPEEPEKPKDPEAPGEPKQPVDDDEKQCVSSRAPAVAVCRANLSLQRLRAVNVSLASRPIGSTAPCMDRTSAFRKAGTRFSTPTWTAPGRSTESRSMSGGGPFTTRLGRTEPTTSEALAPTGCCAPQTT